MAGGPQQSRAGAKAITGVEALGYAEELLRRREVDAALAGFTQAEAVGADRESCCAGRWMASMLRGDFASAWSESDAIRRLGTPDPHRVWQGEDLRGKRVILRCLHGLGDAVQFFRYLPGLRSRAASLVVEVPPALLDLARCFAGAEDVITWGSNAPKVPPDWDVQVEVNELPYLFRTTADELPLVGKYLHLPVPPAKDLALEASDGSSLRVGVVWAGGDWNPSRSLPFELLRPVLELEGCEFWNLQGGSERGRWSQLPAQRGLHNAEACDHSVFNLAATVAQLDVVVTCDTLAAHLAGAQGIAAWVMLEQAADWRWQDGRNDSPWYPSLRLFRQLDDGDWTSVVERVAIELRAASLQRRMVV